LDDWADKAARDNPNSEAVPRENSQVETHHMDKARDNPYLMCHLKQALVRLLVNQ
jgi:hypothetical protein